MPVQIQLRQEGGRRPRRVETPAARYARRLRHLARMREWYARHAGGTGAATGQE
jgi:hypothetical protein